MSPSPSQTGTGDTTYTKVFVGGLAWETQKETMNNYFHQFGDILEAAVISDKATGRSKGYGFVTFREAEVAMRACVDPAPVIDGRRANCNLASQRSKPSTPKHRGGGNRNLRAFQTGFGGGATAFPSATTFPRYALQQALPYNHLYAGYSPDYSYPTSYYNVYGARYPMYGTRMMGAAVGFYPYFQYGGEGGTGQGYGVQYPHHHLFQYPQHYGAPISLTPTPAVQSSGMTVGLDAPMMPHL